MAINRRNFTAALGAGVAALASPNLGATSSSAAKAFDITPYLHPDLRPMVAMMSRNQQ